MCEIEMNSLRGELFFMLAIAGYADISGKSTKKLHNRKINSHFYEKIYKFNFRAQFQLFRHKRIEPIKDSAKLIIYNDLFTINFNQVGVFEWRILKQI